MCLCVSVRVSVHVSVLRLCVCLVEQEQMGPLFRQGAEGEWVEGNSYYTTI